MAVFLALSMAGGTVLLAMPTAQAPFRSLVLTPGVYTGVATYVPGETLTFTINADQGEIYDAVVVAASTNTPLRWYDNVTIPASGSMALTYPIVNDFVDGTYLVEVGGPNYMITRPVGRLALSSFRVQEYRFSIEVDRRAYIGGDTVTMVWTANRIKDGSLAADGAGQIWVYNQTGSLISPSPYVFDKASGSHSFTLPALANPAHDATVFGWFNDSTSTPKRFQSATTGFDIDLLSAVVNVRLNQYPPGGIVATDVTTVVTDNPANPSMVNREPNVNVDITVWQMISGTLNLRPEYGASGLVTDARGQLTHLFKLDANVADQTLFEVRANASRGAYFWEAKDTFTVSVAAGLNVVMRADRSEYQAGDTATMTSTVAGAAGASLTYIYEVRDLSTGSCTTGGILAKQTKTSTETTDTFQYVIPQNYAGAICIRVYVDDGAGNRDFDDRQLPIVFGWLLVNADRQEYNPGEAIAITWKLTSNRITSPTYFYEVWDGTATCGVPSGNLVESGTAVDSFVFSVPAQPSPRYTFIVTATQSGRSVCDFVRLTQVGGFFLTVTFDRASYAPGETMTITYKITPRSSQDVLPATYRFAFGLFNGPTRIVSTDAASGQLTYVIPRGISEGDQLFGISEANTMSVASAVVTIRGTNPLWFVAPGDVPLLVILMLLWLVVLTLMLWRRGALGMMAPKAPSEAPPAPKPEEPVHAPPTSPMTVACRSCGSPIEITTSKRPIEVMCPKCGNTEMVA